MSWPSGGIAGGFLQAQDIQQQMQQRAQQIARAQQDLDNEKRRLSQMSQLGGALAALPQQQAQPPMPGQPSQASAPPSQPPPGQPGPQNAPPAAPGGPQMPPRPMGGAGQPPQPQATQQAPMAAAGAGMQPGANLTMMTIPQMVSLLKAQGVSNDDLPDDIEKLQNLLLPQERLKFETWKAQREEERIGVSQERADIAAANEQRLRARDQDLAAMGERRLDIADRTQRAKEIHDTTRDEITAKHYDSEEARKADLAKNEEWYRGKLIELDGQKLQQTQATQRFKAQVDDINGQVKALQKKIDQDQRANMGMGKADPQDQQKIDALLRKRSQLIETWAAQTGQSKQDIIDTMKGNGDTGSGTGTSPPAPSLTNSAGGSSGSPASSSGISQDQAVQKAKDAIAQGADRSAVIQRLKQLFPGADTGGL